RCRRKGPANGTSPAAYQIPQGGVGKCLGKAACRAPEQAASLAWLPMALRLEFLVVHGGSRQRGRAEEGPQRILTGPEVGRTLAVGHRVAHRLDAVLQVGCDRPQVLVRHVAERRPRHRRGEILGISRKVSLSSSGRGDLYVRGLAGAQSVAQRV